jgi:hypothetical protein
VKPADGETAHRAIVRDDGTCGCPCHRMGALVVHVAECCRRCEKCNKGVPLGVDVHVCRPTTGKRP